eukprot:m.328367 g.328367  ORF g.328367 m.328367 type:complete len:823 (-) comp27690_c0_seq1:63-2531(-)
MSAIPVISQAKSAWQFLWGDFKAAKATQETFLTTCPLLGNITAKVKSFNLRTGGNPAGQRDAETEFFAAVERLLGLPKEGWSMQAGDHVTCHLVPEGHSTKWWYAADEYDAPGQFKFMSPFNGEACAVLEAAFAINPLAETVTLCPVHGRPDVEYTVDFRQMTQTRTTTGFSRTIVCNAPAVDKLSGAIIEVLPPVWEWRNGDKGTWAPSSARVATKCEADFASCVQEKKTHNEQVDDAQTGTTTTCSRRRRPGAVIDGGDTSGVETRGCIRRAVVSMVRGEAAWVVWLDESGQPRYSRTTLTALVRTADVLPCALAAAITAETTEYATYVQIIRDHAARKIKEDNKMATANLKTLPDGIPVLGHVKGAIQYALGEKCEGKQAFMMASRTTGVIAAGAAGVAVLPAAAAATVGTAGVAAAAGFAGLGGGMVMDEVTGLHTVTHAVDAFKDAPAGQKTGAAFDLALQVGGDMLGGIAGGKAIAAAKMNAKLAAVEAAEKQAQANLKKVPLRKNGVQPDMRFKVSKQAVKDYGGKKGGQTPTIKVMHKAVHTEHAANAAHVIKTAGPLATAPVPVAPVQAVIPQRRIRTSQHPLTPVREDHIDITEIEMPDWVQLVAEIGTRQWCDKASSTIECLKYAAEECHDYCGGLAANDHTDDELLAVVLYTHDLYDPLNEMLRGREWLTFPGRQANRSLWGSYLHHAVRGLEKLPLVRDIEVFRGVSFTGHEEARASYPMGRDFQWDSFISTSRSFSKAFQFANKEHAEPVVFRILLTNGRNVQRVSFYPKEAEVLIPPLQRYRVIETPRLQQDGALVIIVQQAAMQQR